MSLELVEKGLERIEREIRQIRRTQLLMLKIWIRLFFADNIPVELVSLMGELERRFEKLEKDHAFSMQKDSEKP